MNVQDNLVKMMLVMLGLSVLIAIVVAVLPDKKAMARGWQDAFANMSHSIKAPLLPGSQWHKQWSSGELRKGRVQVSYNNPQVRSTLNVPWARN